MRRPRGQGLLGGATGLAIVLLVGACGGSSGDAVPAPDPTVEIADAPTTTPAPTAPSAPAEEPTVTPAPAATPEPTTAPELTVEEQVIAAWERYLDLSIQARGKEPSAEALDVASYATEGAKTVLADLLVRQVEERRYIQGVVTSLAPTVTVSDDGDAVLDDCILVDLVTFDFEDAVLLESSDRRIAAVRLTELDGRWRVASLESGDPCGA